MNEFNFENEKNKQTDNCYKSFFLMPKITTFFLLVEKNYSQSIFFFFNHYPLNQYIRY